MDKINLGKSCAPPPGWLGIQDTPRVVEYRKSAPAICPGDVLPDLVGIADWMRSNTAWMKNDIAGRDVWGNHTEEVIKSLSRGERTIIKGECEDLSLVVWDMCRAVGVPLGALRLAVATLPSGTGHCVLVVECGVRSMLWDCNHGSFWPFGHDSVWNEYGWIMASEPGSEQWRTIAT